MGDRRTSITVPDVLDKQIEKHMEETGIKTWNAALWDLVRLGIKKKEQEG
jgi:hypothetical protein